ncbi:hypothetical protein C4E22_01225 [ANME-1 cluster archaeon AG-394-G06]|nr:hypothetical protein [ANME-1 cluster archaeon AG-394-G06]
MKGLPPETILQLIEEAINYIDKQTQNFSLSGIANIDKYEACVDVILNHHQYKNKYKNKKTIEEYFSDLKCSDEFVKENILKPALNSLKQDNKVTIKRFNQKISEYETKEVSRDDNKWYFIFPVNFRLQSKNGIQKEFEICNNVVQLLIYRDFRESEFWSDDVKKQLKDSFHDKSNLPEHEYNWALTNGEGKDWLFALNHSVKNLNKFLGAVNLSYWINRKIGSGKWRRYPETSGYTEIVTPSYVLQYDTNKQFEGLGHFEIGCAVYKSVVFRDSTTKKYQKLIAIFEDLNRLDKESGAYKVICEALEIYNLALNKIGYDSGFLDLWTGLEKMTFRRREGRKNDIPYPIIIKRLLGIMINPPEIIEIRLNEMLDKRHQLVHGGKYDIISRSDFNFLKWKYEMVLSFLMNHNNKFKTIEEIELIYDKSGKTKEELEDEVRVINYLIEAKEMSLENREDKKS